jgi:hypothetical protein
MATCTSTSSSTNAVSPVPHSERLDSDRLPLAPRRELSAPPTKPWCRLRYTSTLIAATLRLREARLVADLLRQGVSDEAWRTAIYDDNLLQTGSRATASNLSLALRHRLEPLGPELWAMVCDGDRVQATQAVLAGAIKTSALLGDFIDIALREQRTLFAPTLELRVWADYIEGCRGRDPDMPQWSQTTLRRLRSVVFSMLAEAGYLGDTKKRRIQPVFVDDALRNLLQRNGERYVRRCMEVME